DVDQLYGGGVVIEALAVGLTVPAYTVDDLAELKDALAEMTELKGHNLDKWEEAHQGYHELLRKHAGERIDRLARDLSDHTGRYRRRYIAAPRARCAAAHRPAR